MQTPRDDGKGEIGSLVGQRAFRLCLASGAVFKFSRFIAPTLKGVNLEKSLSSLQGEGQNE